MTILKQNIPTLCLVKTDSNVQRWVVMLRGDNAPVLLRDIKEVFNWDFQETLDLEIDEFLELLARGGVSNSLLESIKRRLEPAPG